MWCLDGELIVGGVGCCLLMSRVDLSFGTVDGSSQIVTRGLFCFVI